MYIKMIRPATSRAVGNPSPTSGPCGCQDPHAIDCVGHLYNVNPGLVNKIATPKKKLI